MLTCRPEMRLRKQHEPSFTGAHATPNEAPPGLARAYFSLYIDTLGLSSSGPALATIRADIGFVIDCESFQFVIGSQSFQGETTRHAIPSREVRDHGCSDCRYSMPYR